MSANGFVEISAVRPQHQRVIDRLVDLLGHDPRYLGLIIGGSVAKGVAREDSDVDIVLVAADDEYARRKAEGNRHYYNAEVCDYPGGYVDGKIIDMAFLRDVADHGSEPARAAFVQAFLAFSHTPELESLLPRLSAYPEHERADKLRAFYSQVLLLNWYVPEAEKRGDRYLLLQATSSLALFAGRLVLAHNRLLYPYHKWFMHVLRQAPEQPEGFLTLLDALLAEPGSDAANAVCQCLSQWQDWGVSFGQAVNLFMEHAEWNWRDGHAPLCDS